MTGQPWGGPRDIEGAANLEELAFVVERVHAIRIEIEARIDVADESVLRETVPEAGHDIVEFARAAIALVVVQVILSPKVESRVRIGRRHDVPARAAAADMVERREAARDVVGLVKSRGRRRNQADPLGRARERRKQSEGLEGRNRGASSQRLDRHIEHREMVGHEERVEPPAFERLSETLQVLEVEVRVGIGAGIAPPSSVDSHGPHKSAES
jgi:hypothetical protein